MHHVPEVLTKGHDPIKNRVGSWVDSGEGLGTFDSLSWFLLGI